MKPPTDGPSESDAQPTRALLPTEVDVDGSGLADDSERTLEAGTRQRAVRPTGPEPKRPATVAHVSPRPPASKPGGPRPASGTSSRGIVGQIEPGQTLYGKYQVLRKLGGGAMGDVWLIRHATLKSEHALKVIIPNIASNSVALMRFQREFEIMASLRHEHAVSIYDACIDVDGGYIDMEFVEGRTIHEVVAEARNRPGRDRSAPMMPLEWIDRVLDQLCDVLQVAHEKGIVHRDLKPANLMLLGGRKPGKEYLKVLDFGIAKIRDDPDNVVNQGDSELKTVGFIGTPSFGSPEQALSRDDIDGRSDIYSVAVMVYEFVTGQLPFKGNHWQIMHQHASVAPPPFAAVAPELRPMPEVERAVLRALAKDRDQRPQTAREFHDEFHEAVLAIHPSLADRPAPPPSSWRGGPIPEAPQPPTQRDEPEPSREAPHPTAPIIPPSQPPRPEPAGDPGPVPGPTPVVGVVPARRRPWGWAVAVAISAAVLAAAYAFRAVPGRLPPPLTDIDTAGLKTWEDYLPAGYEAEKGYVDATLWPAKIRRTADVVTFNRFAPGIYLPEGYAPEDPNDLEDGWPRVIVREGDPRRARYLRIKGGTGWTMGDRDAEPGPGHTDAPAHPVVVSGHYVAETEVTNGQLDDFLRKTARPAPNEWEAVLQPLRREVGQDAWTHPAVNVTRQLAQEYASHVRGLLPTEAQWEFDARSQGEPRRHVWGDRRPGRDLARIDKQDNATTAPVGSFPSDRTKQGAVDFNGNVLEWCRDEWEPYRKLDRPLIDPCGVAPNKETAEFVVRGAAFSDIPDDCALTRRQKQPGGEVAPNLGFRVVIECPDSRKPRP